MRKSAVILWSILLVAAVGVIWLGNHFGQWYFTFLVTLMIGLWGKPGFWTWLGAWITGMLGWGLPLAVLAVHAPVGRTSAVVTGIMGLGERAWLGIVFTLVISFLMSTVGVWLGAALHKWRIQAMR